MARAPPIAMTMMAPKTSLSSTARGFPETDPFEIYRMTAARKMTVGDDSRNSGCLLSSRHTFSWTLPGQARGHDRVLEQGGHCSGNPLGRAHLEKKPRRCTAAHGRADLVDERLDILIVPGIGRQRQIGRVQHGNQDAAILQRGAQRHIYGLLAASAAHGLLRA